MNKIPKYTKGKMAKIIIELVRLGKQEKELKKQISDKDRKIKSLDDDVDRLKESCQRLRDELRAASIFISRIQSLVDSIEEMNSTAFFAIQGAAESNRKFIYQGAIGARTVIRDAINGHGLKLAEDQKKIRMKALEELRPRGSVTEGSQLIDGIKQHAD